MGQTTHIPSSQMNVVFKINSDIFAANIAEWFISGSEAVVFLAHSEYEEIIIENGKAKLDGTEITILEMTPDIRKYI
jgi:predicted regulator of Ras-like GTPase activity (Roadblock/LC7/MglB family)